MTARFDPVLDCDLIDLGIGEVYVSRDDESLTTVLGTCVGVGLYDPISGVGGLNHFILAEPGSDPATDSSEPGRYGTNAMRLLHRALTSLGAATNQIRAKVFGGGTPSGSTPGMNRTVAAGNIELAFEYLRRMGIPVESSDVGGEASRRVVFEPRTGRARVKRFGWTVGKDSNDDK